MFNLNENNRIVMSQNPTDMRIGVNGMCGYVRRVGLDPTNGDVYIFVGWLHSYCAWQKGAIENANKLIRRYIPKKADFSKLSDRKIMMIQKKINRGPDANSILNTHSNAFSDISLKFALAVGLYTHLQLTVVTSF